MNRLFTAIVAVVALLAFMVPAPGQAHDSGHLRSHLSGFNELHGPNLGIGAIFSTGSGRIKLRIDKENRQIHFELTYAFPDASVGTQFVNQAHLHFGQKHTTGGITVWLCDSADNPAPGTVTADTCPSPSGTVTGTISPQDVLAPGPANQGFPAGEDGFDALLQALRAGAIYANVHTDRFGPGEIRGQLGDEGND